VVTSVTVPQSWQENSYCGMLHLAGSSIILVFANWAFNRAVPSCAFLCFSRHSPGPAEEDHRVLVEAGRRLLFRDTSEGAVEVTQHGGAEGSDHDWKVRYEVKIQPAAS
jgi:hypothetical protein